VPLNERGGCPVEAVNKLMGPASKAQERGEEGGGGGLPPSAGQGDHGAPRGVAAKGRGSGHSLPRELDEGLETS
jgi:hypothetical protein